MFKWTDHATFHKDFPKPGVNFVDINPILKDTYLQKHMSFSLLEPFLTGPGQSTNINSIVGIEARGFILGGMVSVFHSIPFIPFRKPGKLPGKLVSHEYTTEYSSTKLEAQNLSLSGKNILLIDDVFATGGSLLAAKTLAEKLGAHVIGASVLFTVKFLHDEINMEEKFGKDFKFHTLDFI